MLTVALSKARTAIYDLLPCSTRVTVVRSNEIVLDRGKGGVNPWVRHRERNLNANRVHVTGNDRTRTNAISTAQELRCYTSILYCRKAARWRRDTEGSEHFGAVYIYRPSPARTTIKYHMQCL